jgi:hypothetical protein
MRGRRVSQCCPDVPQSFRTRQPGQAALISTRRRTEPPRPRPQPRTDHPGRHAGEVAVLTADCRPYRRCGVRSPGPVPSLSVTLSIGITSEPTFDPAPVGWWLEAHGVGILQQQMHEHRHPLGREAIECHREQASRVWCCWCPPAMPRSATSGQAVPPRGDGRTCGRPCAQDAGDERRRASAACDDTTGAGSPECRGPCLARHWGAVTRNRPSRPGPR